MSDPVTAPTTSEDGVSGTPTVLYRVDEGVAWITINRPERRNAMSWEVMRGLRTTIAAAAQDREVRVVVLAGAGEDGVLRRR